MKALIDGDIFQYEFGDATDNEYKILPWPLIQARIDNRISGIMEAVKADTKQIFITSDDKSNFRYKLATIQPYKGKRKTDKPYWYYHIRNFLVDYRGAIEVFGQEADDAMSIAQMEELRKYSRNLRMAKTVICSRDKDLHNTPGWHYTWPCGKQKERPIWWQDEVGANRCFYKQLITGDNDVDNILGLYGVGKQSKLLSTIDNLSTPFNMYRYVLELYQKRFGSYAEKFLLENARLLWMRREEDEMWEFPTE